MNFRQYLFFPCVLMVPFPALAQGSASRCASQPNTFNCLPQASIVRTNVIPVAVGDDARSATVAQVLGQMIGSDASAALGYTPVIGAALNGSTDDSAAVAAAIAASAKSGAPILLPGGVASVTSPSGSLTGRFVGPGVLKTAGNLRPMSFARRATAPSSYGNQDSSETAFNGDLSTVHIAIDHRIDGAATLTQPTTGYVATPEASAQIIHLQNTSGWNNGTGDNNGRTGLAATTVHLAQVGQGDVFGYQIGGYSAGTRAGSTHFLANPAVVGFAGDFYGFADGTYQEVDEFNHHDAGKDVAVSSTVRNFYRSNNTGAKGAWWLAYRLQSLGPKESS